MTVANVLPYSLGMANQHRIDVARLKNEMARRFWNQARLAEAAGVSEGSVSLVIRRGTTTATLAGKLAAVLDLTPRQIYRRLAS